MAVLGQVLTAPEAGWIRREEFSPSMTFNGSWTDITHTSYSNSKGKSSSLSEDSLSFSFNGTGLRVIGGMHSVWSSYIEIFIDGARYTFSARSSSSNFTYQNMLFSVENLDPTNHVVEIINKQDANFLFDAIDIKDGKMIIGDILTAPESGWKRYDDTPIIKYSYSGVANIGSSSAGSYKGTTSSFQSVGDKASFNFSGTKVRVIVFLSSNRSRSVTVKINGIIEGVIDCYAPSNIYQSLIFEKLNLPQGVHLVELINNETAGFALDAIDIDSTGRLFHPDEVTDLKDLAVGKRIRCNYKSATANTVGTFSGFGQETKDFISVASSATPDGDFYYIMVEDSNGIKKLIADRNIQHSISWDVLNTAGIASGSGVENLLPTIINTNSERESIFTTRLLTGGTASTDKDNEWDKYIVNSTLGGAITAGDNNVWNWGISLSLTNTVYSTNTYRVDRGRASVSTFDYNNSGSASTALGFRPVLLIESIFVQLNKSFILLDGKYKKWVEGNLASGGYSSSLNIIPIMTSDIVPSGQSFSSGNQGTSLSYMAFDQSLTSNWTAPNNLLSGIIGYLFSSQRTVGSYSIVGSSGTPITRYPKKWTFEGSNDSTDGINGIWEIVDTRDVSDWILNTKKIFTITTPKSFSAYRLNITANNGDTVYLQIGEIEMFEYIPFMPATSPSWQTVSATLPSLDTFKGEGIDDLSVFDRKATVLTQPMTSEVLGAGKLMKSKVDLNKYFDLNSLNVK